MPISGKLLGALIGSIAGPLGTLLGGLIGHLFDRAAEERQFLGATSSARRAALDGAGDPVSQAQVNFLACLIGLSISVADADGKVRASHVQAMKEFFQRNFPFGPRDHELIQRLIEETYRNRRAIDVAGLCGYYAAVAPFEGRVLLLRLLFQIARADPAGVSTAEGDLIRRICVNLGLESRFSGRSARKYWETPAAHGRSSGCHPVRTLTRSRPPTGQLSMRNHPDKVASLGPEFVKVAEERFKAIQEAYEEVRRERGF